MKLLNLFKTKKVLIIFLSIILIIAAFIAINFSINIVKTKTKEKELYSIKNNKYTLQNKFDSLAYKKTYESKYNTLLSQLENSIINENISKAKSLINDLETLYEEVYNFSENFTKERNNIENVKNNIKSLYIPEEYKDDAQQIISKFDTMISDQDIKELQITYNDLNLLYQNCNKEFISNITSLYNYLTEEYSSKLDIELNDNLLALDSTLKENIENIKSEIDNFKNSIDNVEPKNTEFFESEEYEEFSKKKDSISDSISELYSKINELNSTIQKNEAKQKNDSTLKLVEDNGFTPYNLVKNILGEFIQVDKIDTRVVETVSKYHITSTTKLNSTSPTYIVYHYYFSNPKLTSEGVTYTFEMYKYEDRANTNPDNFDDYKLSLDDGKITYLKDGTIKYKNKTSVVTRLQPYE